MCMKKREFQEASRIRNEEEHSLEKNRITERGYNRTLMVYICTIAISGLDWVRAVESWRKCTNLNAIRIFHEKKPV